jgi:hypothetical protein
VNHREPSLRKRDSLADAEKREAELEAVVLVKFCKFEWDRLDL